MGKLHMLKALHGNIYANKEPLKTSEKSMRKNWALILQTFLRLWKTWKYQAIVKMVFSWPKIEK